MKRILLSLDLRRGIDEIIEQAYMLAKRFGAEVIPVHTIAHLPLYSRHAETKLIREHVQNHLTKVEEDLRLREVEVFEPIIPEGKPYNEVLKIAQTLGVDLIIIGSGKESKAGGQKSIGSNAARIVRKSNVPVWICNSAIDLENLNRIVCTVDFSEHSKRTLETAVIICRALNGTLNIAHVVPEIDYYPGLVDESIAVSPWGASAYTTEIYGSRLKYNSHREEELIETEFASFLEPFDLKDLDYHITVCHGRPDSEIKKLCRDSRSGLVVMGAKGSSNILMNFLGGTIEKITRDLPCSLLAVK